MTEPDPLHLDDRARVLFDSLAGLHPDAARETLRRALDRAGRAGWFHARDDLLSAVYAALQRAERAQFGAEEPREGAGNGGFALETPGNAPETVTPGNQGGARGS